MSSVLQWSMQTYRKTGKELCIVVTNISSGYVEYCHVKTTPYLPVIDAVRMTLATPGNSIIDLSYHIIS